MLCSQGQNCGIAVLLLLTFHPGIAKTVPWPIKNISYYVRVGFFFFVFFVAFILFNLFFFVVSLICLYESCLLEGSNSWNLV